VDIVEIAKPVTKWVVQVKEAAQLPWIFREAFRIARSCRPGPVLIDLLIDVQKQQIEWDAAIDEPLPFTKPTPTQARVERALDLLLEVERPLILVGAAWWHGQCEDHGDLQLLGHQGRRSRVDPGIAGVGRARRPAGRAVRCSWRS
jgi:tartronate-semialdehyde synthase